MASERLEFTVLGRAIPQGSMKNIARKGKRSLLIHSNKKLLPWRDQVGEAALKARVAAGCYEIYAGRHVPVGVSIDAYYERPKSVSRDRMRPSTAPDWDKLCRAVSDALAGILYVNDGQIVEGSARKHYGLPERAEIAVWRVEA